MKDTIQYGKNQDILDTTAGVAVKGKEGVLLMQAGQDVTTTGATLAALGENGSMILSAGHNLTMDTDSLEAKKDMTENSDNYIRTYRKTETANTLTAGKDISLISGNDIKARNTTVASENGAITAKAGNDVTIENGYNEAADDFGLKYKESGFLSHKTTAIKNHDERKTATGSMFSGDTVTIVSGGNTNVTASNIVGTNDVSITAGKDTTITSAEEVEQHDYEKRVKKSGLLGGGLGFTIGSEKRNDQYADADVTQKGSTVGSIAGNVTIESGKDIHVNASDIIAGTDIFLTGKNVDISSKDNVYHSDEKHEYKKSGLTVSVGGATIDAINSVIQPITRASEVKDKRLAGLYAVKAGQEANQISKTYKGQQDVINSLYDKAGKESDLWAKGKDWKEADKVKDNQLGGKNTFTLNVGIGSSHSHAESHSESTVAQGSQIQASGDVTIKATKEDIQIKGSQVSGENVNLQAKKDITISAAENSNKTTEETKSSGSSIGASIGIGGLQGIQASYSKAKGNVKENATTYEKSDIHANKDLTFTSGKDTTITGSTMAGDRVTGNVGGNLSIETKQERNTYEEKNTSAGVSINYGVKEGKTSLSGGASRGNTKSNYESAKDQSGIRAGKEGYDITVKDNTHLKGGLIDSDAAKEKNTLTTGTLTWEDIDNKADYKAGGAGISYTPKDTNTQLNQKGLTPSMTPTVKGKADSTTKSAVADGTITITDKEHQKQDVSTLNRDTKNALNQLEDIFDKTKVEEKQELIGMLEKYGNQAIHTYAESKGWKDGSTEKMLLHGAFGALMGDMAGGSAASGALSGGVNEYVMGYLTKKKGEDWVQEHPDTVQWISAGVGAAIGASAKDMATGANVALDASKWNYLGFGMDTTPLLKRTLKSKTGQALSEEEWNKIHSDLIRIAAEADLFGAESDQLEIGNETAKQNVRNYLVGKGFTIDSTEEFITGYDSWVRDLQKRMNGIPRFKGLPQVTVIASQIKDGTLDIQDVAWDKSQDILTSTGLSWGAANWYEAEYGYLSRKEAEQIGQEMSNATMKAWGNIAYLKEVCDNHKRYNSFENALRADGYDTLPITVGIVTSSILATRGSYIQFIGVGVTGAAATWYAKNKKETLSKNAPNVDNQENRGE